MEQLNKKSLKKLPPHDIEAEQAVLGALLIDCTRLPDVLEIIQLDDFYRPSHHAIFEMIHTVITHHGQIDLLLLKAEADRRNFEDLAYLAALVDVVPSAANVTHHAQIVKEKAQKRRLLNQCILTACEIYDDQAPFDEYFSKLTEGISTFSNERAEWVRTVGGVPKGINERHYVKQLESLGFRAIMFNNALTFGKIQEQIVEEVQFFKSICFTLKNELKNIYEDEHPSLWELLLKENKFDYKVLTSLQVVEQEEFLADSLNACHLYFQNGVVTITPDTVNFAPYDQLTSYVWKDAITPYPYQGRFFPECVLDLEEEQKSERHSDFERFIRLVSCQEIDGHFVDNKLPFEHGIAHLCWHHNDVLNQKAVILIDNDPSYFSDGRRGKRIFMDALRYVRSNGTPDGVVIKEDGKSFSGQFKFQRVKPNTKILIVDDVDDETVNFKQFYSAITDGLVKEGKGLQRFAFTPESSPKIAFTTNRPFFSVDHSSMDRMIILPMTDYFTRDGNKPIQVFGHRLYYDWDPPEWARFHDYIIRIIQEEMRHDPMMVPEPDLAVFNANRLLLELPEAFTGYLDQLKNDHDYEKTTVLTDLEELGFTFKHRGRDSFKTMLEKYCRLRGRQLFKNTRDGRYVTNSKEYLRFQPDLFT